MILNITAMASLALPSAVSVAPRVQSHRSQRLASFGRGCPQYGQGISSPTLCSGRVAGASVYSTLISIIEGGHAEFVKQSCCWPRDSASVESAAKVERRASSFPRILHPAFRHPADWICGEPLAFLIEAGGERIYIAIGNTVNVASHMQGLTKTTERPLLVTAAVRDRSGDSFSFEELPPQEVRGIEGRLSIFAVQNQMQS